MFVALLRAATLLSLLSHAAQSRSHRPRIVRRDDGPVYTPVSPSALADSEVRSGGSHASAGDYVMHGLDTTMDMVSREYGLRDSESFYWGLDGRPMANVTAYAYGKDVRVLSMERFENVLETAECTANSVKLTFTQEVQFDQVQSGWQWINQATENYIVLVTDTSRCNVPDGDATDRQPWHISHADFDDATNTVTLAAEPRTWDEAFSNWRLEFDSRGLGPQHSSKTKRQLASRSAEDPDIDLNSDVSGIGMNLSPSGSISCEKCYTSGGLDFRINADVGLFSGVKGSLEVDAYNLGAHMEVDANIPFQGTAVDEKAVEISLKNIRKKLLIKDLGIDVGPALTFALVASLDASDRVDVKGGFDFKLNHPKAFYKVDFHNLGFDAPTGKDTWDSTFTPTPVSYSNNVSLTGKISSQLRLSWGGSINKGGFGGAVQAGVVLAAPILYLTGTPKLETGACNDPAASAGVDLVLGVGAGVYLQESASVNLGFRLDKAATQTIAETTTPLASTCIPITASLEQNAPSGTYKGSSGAFQTSGSGPPYTNTSTPSNPYPWGTGTCGVNEALVCRDDTHFGLCNFGKVVWQPVAPGTGCYAGRIVGTGIYALPGPTGSPSIPTSTGTISSTGCTHGLLYCSDDGSQYALCNWRQLTFQDVADGTACQAGKIVGTGVYAVPVQTPPPSM